MCKAIIPVSGPASTGIGHVIRLARITRNLVRANPGTLYVFGDNMARRGLGGQAREMRGEPNAIGVPTKWAPTRSLSDFFKDTDFLFVRPAIDAAFDCLIIALREGGNVAIPSAGIGTGLAELPTRAPLIHAYIEDRIARLPNA